MSILNRPGWANKELVNEGLLHTDGLKQRITNLFKRTSLGNSPTYIVGKIADALRMESGKDLDVDSIPDEDIIRVANSESITRGKFRPELKDGIADSRQEMEGDIPDVADSGLPSQSSNDGSFSSHLGSDEEEFEDFYEDDLDMDHGDSDVKILQIKSKPIFNDEEDDLEFAFRGDGDSFQEDSEESSDDEEEDAEEVKTCGCEKTQSPFHKEYAKNNLNKIKKTEQKTVAEENTKLSPSQVNQLLKENYFKSKQHRFRMEEKYRNY